MFYEAAGDYDSSAVSDADIDKINQRKAQENQKPLHPWPALSEHAVDGTVAKAINGSRAEARELPLRDFFEILVDSQAQTEAMPARIEHQEAEAERKRTEKKSSLER